MIRKLPVARASAKAPAIFCSVFPTHLLISSEARFGRGSRPIRFASCFAYSDFPLPDGPSSRIPIRRRPIFTMRGVSTARSGSAWTREKSYFSTAFGSAVRFPRRSRAFSRTARRAASGPPPGAIGNAAGVSDLARGDAAVGRQFLRNRFHVLRAIAAASSFTKHRGPTLPRNVAEFQRAGQTVEQDTAGSSRRSRMEFAVNSMWHRLTSRRGPFSQCFALARKREVLQLVERITALGSSVSASIGVLETHTPRHGKARLGTVFPILRPNRGSRRFRGEGPRKLGLAAALEGRTRRRRFPRPSGRCRPFARKAPRDEQAAQVVGAS